MNEGGNMYKTTKCFFLSKVIVTSLVVVLFLISDTTYAESIFEYLTPTSDSSPAGLDFDSKGNLWFAEINGNKIGKLNPSEVEPGTSKGIIEYELPRPNSKPQYLMVSRDDTVGLAK